MAVSLKSFVCLSVLFHSYVCVVSDSGANVQSPSGSDNDDDLLKKVLQALEQVQENLETKWESTVNDMVQEFNASMNKQQEEIQQLREELKGYVDKGIQPVPSKQDSSVPALPTDPVVPSAVMTHTQNNPIPSSSSRVQPPPVKPVPPSPVVPPKSSNTSSSSVHKSKSSSLLPSPVEHTPTIKPQSPDNSQESTDSSDDIDRDMDDPSNTGVIGIAIAIFVLLAVGLGLYMAYQYRYQVR